MATSSLYRVLYRNLAWVPGAGAPSIVDHSDTAVTSTYTPAGFGAAQAFDGNRASVCTVLSTYTQDSFALRFDRGVTGAPSGWLEDNTGLALINHTVYSSQCILVTLYTDDDSAYGSKTQIGAWVPDSDDDVLIEFDTKLSERYIEVRFSYTGSDPAVDVEIGQCYVGNVLSFDQIGNPAYPIISTPELPSIMIPGETGGIYSSRQRHRYRATTMSFLLDSTALADMRDFVDQTNGTQPFCMTTTDDTYIDGASTSGTGDNYTAGCRFAMLDGVTAYQEQQVGSGTWEASLAVRTFLPTSGLT